MGYHSHRQLQIPQYTEQTLQFGNLDVFTTAKGSLGTKCIQIEYAFKIPGSDKGMSQNSIYKVTLE